MLTEEAFSLYCQRLGFSKQAQAVLTAIQSSPPARRMGSGRKNVPVRYPSRKMGVIIQAESYKNELAGVYEMEHDPAVLEYFDQPSSIKLQYQAKNGRPIGVLHTPDYFVIRADAAGWEEWKMEEDLIRLADQMPHRYVRRDDGQWRCPPGEAVAAPLGFYYRVRSSADIQWMFQRNLRFLSSYLREDCPNVTVHAQQEIISLVIDNPGLSLAELLKRLAGASSDDLYTLIATEQLYVDVHTAPLAEPERVRIFRDEETARAWAVTLADMSSPFMDCPHMVLVQAGAPVVWDSRPFTIVNTGVTTTTLLSEDSTLIELPNSRFQTLVAQGKLVGLTEVPRQGSVSTEVRERLIKAGKPALQEAYRRYTLIKPVLDRQPLPSSTTPVRTIRLWKANYREAQQTLGCGFVGLLPQVHQRGNRLPRLPEQTIATLNEFIEKEYENHKQKNKREVYGEFVTFCNSKGAAAIPSYKTFVAVVNRRPRYEQAEKRVGHRAAYRHEPLYWELTFTLPRHGDRPFEMVHIDHTQLDVELVDSRTGHHFGRPWATFLTDAFSRRELAVYLTFDEPSYRSCMMVLRECVHRYHRLPELIVVDWGPEFESIYFETLLARYECSKASRPKAKPRFGSVIERLFGTANTQFVHNLAGNTQVMKNVRQVTKSVDPREHALWTLGELYVRLREWAYQVYDTQEHAALGQTPEAAFTAGLLQSGMRANRLIPYDDDFILSTFPSTSKGTAKVQPNLGVKIKYLYYWARGDAFHDPQVEKTQVPVRYDPYDVGHAYAFVKGRWVECISEYYARFKGRSERELHLVTEELRQRNRHHAQQFTITAAKLADFITSVEAQEVLMAQRQRDDEAKTVFALMEGRSLPLREDSAPQGLQGVGIKQGGTTALSSSKRSTSEGDGSTDDDDIYEDF